MWWMYPGLGLLSAALRYAFGGNQLVEPIHFPFARLQPELMQLAGVAVEGATGPRHCFTQAFPAFFYLATAPFQDAHPRLGRRAVEKCQVHAEAVVGVVMR